MERGLKSHAFKSGLPSSLGPPVIQGSKFPPFSLSIIHIPWNNPNGELYEEHIWVLSTIQTSRKQNASYKGRFQTISKIKPVRLLECSDR